MAENMIESKNENKDNVDNAIEVNENMSFAGCRVMLVEDNYINQMVAKCMLEDCGAIVETVDDGTNACETFYKSDTGYFDYIFMDIQMPEMNGYEAAKKIRNSGHPQATTIPIIAVTANDFLEDETEYVSSGMNACLTKPLNKEKLNEILKSIS